MDKGKFLSNLTLSACLFLSTIIYGQEQRPALVLKDIYSSRVYRQNGFGPVRWMKDNQGYSTLEPSTNGGDDIARYDASSGARTVLVSAKQLIPAGEKNALGIDDYEWSEDNSKLLIFTNTKRVWRYNTRGDYWMLDLKPVSSYNWVGQWKVVA
jgi:dipeptidyl-peptidase-4